MNLQEIFICNLKRIRKEKNITQEKLAEKCQSDTAYIGQIETGKRFPSIHYEALISIYEIISSDKKNQNNMQ